MGYLVAIGAIGFGYRALTIPAMVVFGWACVWFKEDLADFLGLPASRSPGVMGAQRWLIHGLGWLSLVVAAGLILIVFLNR